MSKATQVVDTPTADVSAIIGQTINKIVAFSTATNTNTFDCGRELSSLKALTAPYEKDAKSGLSYNASVKKAGLSHGTAELWRTQYETLVERNIPEPVFTALVRKGVNLSSDRFEELGEHAEAMKALQEMTVADEPSVWLVAEALRKWFPTPKGEGTKDPTAEVARIKAELQEAKADLDGIAGISSDDPRVSKLAAAEQKRIQSKVDDLTGEFNEELVTLAFLVRKVIVGLLQIGEGEKAREVSKTISELVQQNGTKSKTK